MKICACGKEFIPKSNSQIHCNRRCQNPKNHNGLEFTEAQRNYKYKINYGISIEDYNDIFEDQQGRCAICKKHQLEFKKKLHVDHKHETGQIRGLLCQTCNQGLGLFKDDPELLQAALEYVS